MTDKSLRYCPLCDRKRQRSNDWFTRLIFGIKTWVCPEHKDKV
jgi:hypothetical protein